MPDEKFFTAIEENDCCPYGIRAFIVVDSVPFTSTLHIKTGREDFALTYVLDGAYIYSQPDCSEASFECARGELSFLPSGSVYIHRCEQPSRMYVVYFSLEREAAPTDGISKITVSDPALFERLFSEIIERYFRLPKSELSVKAAVCELFSALAAGEALQKLSERELAMLTPALDALTDYMVSRSYEPPTVAGLARLCYMSEYSFRELFKRYTGMTPKKYIDLRRIEKVESYLSSTDISVTKAAAVCGFGDPAYFFKLYKRIRGRPPGQAR